jgi:hypothetical protein
MSEDTQNPADPAAVAQDEFNADPATEVAADPAASQDPSDELLESDPESELASDEDEVDEEPAELQPGQTLAALRGIPAGPAPHPRTV